MEVTEIRGKWIAHFSFTLGHAVNFVNLNRKLCKGFEFLTPTDRAKHWMKCFRELKDHLNAAEFSEFKERYASHVYRLPKKVVPPLNSPLRDHGFNNVEDEDPVIWQRLTGHLDSAICNMSSAFPFDDEESYEFGTLESLDEFYALTLPKNFLEFVLYAQKVRTAVILMLFYRYSS